MRAQPGADLSLDGAGGDQGAHHTGRVSPPAHPSLNPSIDSCSNTPCVAQHADAVRTRLREYMQFGAVIRLPADTPLPSADLSIQPLQVILKAGKKPRLVIDLSRNLNDHPCVVLLLPLPSASVCASVQYNHPALGGCSNRYAMWRCPRVPPM